MNNLCIAGININFKSLDDQFNIELNKYRTNNSSDYYIKTEVVDFITLNPEAVVVNQHMRIKEEPYQTSIYYLNKKNIVNQKVVYTNDFKRINVYLLSALKDKIYLQEYLITGVYFFEIALRENIISLHASAIVYNDNAILFSGPSGTGKSTQAQLWCNNYSTVKYINDDKPLLRINSENKVIVYGSPWSGKSYLNENVSYPLKTICFLEQSLTNELVELTTSDKIKLILKNTHRSFIKENQEKLLENINRLLYSDIYKYKCLPNQTSVSYLRSFIYGDDDE